METVTHTYIHITTTDACRGRGSMDGWTGVKEGRTSTAFTLSVVLSFFLDCIFNNRASSSFFFLLLFVTHILVEL